MNEEKKYMEKLQVRYLIRLHHARNMTFCQFVPFYLTQMLGSFLDISFKFFHQCFRQHG